MLGDYITEGSGEWRGSGLPDDFLSRVSIGLMSWNKSQGGKGQRANICVNASGKKVGLRCLIDLARGAGVLYVARSPPAFILYLEPAAEASAERSGSPLNLQ